jgi:hypothetical protein
MNAAVTQEEKKDMATIAIDFARRASEAELEALAARLRERNFEAVIVDSGADARAAVVERLPVGAQVHSGKSKTLEDAGIFKELMESDRYDFVRRRTYKLDQRTRETKFASWAPRPTSCWAASRRSPKPDSWSSRPPVEVRLVPMPRAPVG